MCREYFFATPKIAFFNILVALNVTGEGLCVGNKRTSLFIHPIEAQEIREIVQIKLEPDT